MTLSTNIYILDQVDAREVFKFCQGLLAKYDDRPGRPRQQESVDLPGNVFNQIGQGLPAILDVRYGESGPLVTAEQSAAHDEDCPPDCGGEYHDAEYWVNVDFDTSYGYRDSRGWRCNELHAALVVDLGTWLNGRGIRWSWRNEYTGDIHPGPGFESLESFFAAGDKAQDWFVSMVLPAIHRGLS
jgi:hypothetical protein